MRIRAVPYLPSPAFLKGKLAPEVVLFTSKLTAGTSMLPTLVWHEDTPALPSTVSYMMGRLSKNSSETG